MGLNNGAAPAVKPKRPFKTNRVGFSLKNGKFYFFDRRQIIVMKGWPAPFAWRRTTRIPWHPTRQHASPVLRDLISPLCPDTEDDLEFFQSDTQEERERRKKGVAWGKHVAEAFFAPVPEGVRDVLLQLADRHWNLFSLLARCPGAVDLAHSNPALCFALASCWVFHKPAPTHPLREARRLVLRKQKEIMRWLGFPSMESARRIMAKISLSDLTIPRLLNLRRAIENATLSKTLAHLPRINGFILDVVGSWYEPLVRPSFLHEVAALQVRIHGEDPLQFLKDTMRMSRELGGRLPNGFGSIAQLVRTHDGLSGWHRQHVPPQLLSLSLPSPPFEGTPGIVPLTSPAEVIREAHEMHNCCSSYIQRIADGACYLYRVLAPVRATLELVRWEGGWRVGQLEQYANNVVGGSMRRHIIAALLYSETHA